MAEKKIGNGAKSEKAKGNAGRTTLDQDQKTRVWLMYPPRLIKTPIIWELGHKFQIITNVRQASVNDEIGIVCLEMEGKRSEVKNSIKWLEGKGVRVEPVEINVIES
jgi:L-aspartate semialdehyde sulfurtransferase ferredoxin